VASSGRPLAPSSEYLEQLLGINGNHFGNKVENSAQLDIKKKSLPRNSYSPTSKIRR